MNEKVTKIVEHLFQDLAFSEEVSALHDEVLNNCQERFADLIRSGLSETESLAAVAESLSGMDEVLKDYPRKETPAEARPADSAEGSAEGSAADGAAAEPDDRAPSLSRFDPDQIRSIDAQLTACDLEVAVSHDGGCSLEVTGDVRMRLEADGTLRLWQPQITESLFRGMDWESSLNSLDQLGNTLNQFGKNISRFFSQFLGKDILEARAVLRLPPALHPQARIRTTSGDVSWRDLVPGQEMTLRTTSGDIRIDVERDYLLPHVEISTMSGDAELSFSADRLKISSVSGDLSWRGNANSLSMNTTSGDVEAAGSFPDAVLNTTSGDISLDLASAEPAEIRVSAVSGNIDLRLPRDVREVAAALKSVSGDVRLRGVEQTENAPIRIDAHTVSGDLKISS